VAQAQQALSIKPLLNHFTYKRLGHLAANRSEAAGCQHEPTQQGSSGQEGWGARGWSGARGWGRWEGEGPSVRVFLIIEGG